MSGALQGSVAIYARVSSDQQCKEDTIASQVAALRQRVRDDGLNLRDDYCFADDGYSGSTLIRPALEQLRDTAAVGAIDRLYVLAPDRLARSYAYQVLLLEEFQSDGVAVVFLNHAIGKSPEENLLLQVQGMVAEYERAKILERCRRGKLHAARRGLVNVLAAAPYGYRYLPRHANAGVACYQVLAAEARLVQQMFHWVGHERCSLRDVCRRLQKQGICSPKGQTRWSPTTVRGILTNPAYQGTAHWGKTRRCAERRRLRTPRGQSPCPRRLQSRVETPLTEQIPLPVPALIEPDLFGAVAEQLQENRRRNRQRLSGARYLLGGLLVCQRCGRAYCGIGYAEHPHGGYGYYRCSGAIAGAGNCDNRPLRGDLLEAEVWNDAASLLADPERLRQEYERRRCGQTQPAELKRLQAGLHRAQQSVARLIDAYEAGLLERAEFEPRIQQAKERLHQLEAEAQRVAQEQTQEQHWRELMDRFGVFAQRVADGLHEASWNTRRDILRALVKQVEVDGEEVRILYKISPQPMPPQLAAG